MDLPPYRRLHSLLIRQRSSGACLVPWSRRCSTNVSLFGLQSAETAFLPQRPVVLFFAHRYKQQRIPGFNN
jgi:hypothetical protein